VALSAILLQVLGSPTAANITALWTNSLTKVSGMTVDNLKCKVISISTDGASVMTGEHNGVVRKLRDTLAPHSVPHHCAAHRTDLAAGVLEKSPPIRNRTEEPADRTQQPLLQKRCKVLRVDEGKNCFKACATASLSSEL
jgi:hypothetical protein